VWLHSIAPRRVLCLSGRSRSPGQKLQAPPELAEHGIGRKELDPRCGQFYGERQAVETCADLGYRRGILVGDGEVRLRGPRLSMKSLTASYWERVSTSGNLFGSGTAISWWHLSVPQEVA
jgi:hypothetical protein